VFGIIAAIITGFHEEIGAWLGQARFWVIFIPFFMIFCMRHFFDL
jgi:hypothetical protein